MLCIVVYSAYVNDYITIQCFVLIFFRRKNVSDFSHTSAGVCVITISEIAKLAGVSVATVSRVLNHSGTVSEETGRRVQEIVEKYNYTPNLLGRHLRKMETKIILVILTSVSNSFSSRVVSGIDEEARKHGYHTLVCMTNDSMESEKSYLDMLRNGVADGAIIMNTRMDKDAYHVFSEMYPAVQCSEYVDEASPYVAIDNEQAAYDAVTHLLSLGRRRIAYCGVKNDFKSSYKRYVGYARALEDFGVAMDGEIVFDGNYGFRSAYHLTEERIKSGKVFDALFSISDRMAAGAIRAITDSGLCVPADVAVVGFDNIDIAYMAQPTITTISQPKSELGKEAFLSLLDRMNGKMPENKILQYQMVLRESTKIKGGK